MAKILLSAIFILSGVFSTAQFWTETSSGFSTDLIGLSKFHAVDANIAWAVAYDGINTANNIQRFSKTDDAGFTWTTGDFNLGDPNLGIANVSGVDANTAFVAAYPRQAGQQSGVWKSTDAGVTWTRQTGATFNNAASFPNIVHYFDANTGVVIGDPTGGYWEIYRSTDGGSTYSRVPASSLPAPLANEFGYLAQFAYSGNSIWFTTSEGRIIHSANLGLTWNAYQSPLSDFGGTTISGDLSFATVDRGVIQDNTGSIFKSTDAGQTWTNVVFSGTGSPYGGAISYVPGTFHMVSTGGETSFAGSSYSLDDGITWINIDTDQHIDCAFFNDSVGYSGSFSDATNNLGVFRYSSTVLNEELEYLSSGIQILHHDSTEELEIISDQQIKSVTIYDLSGRIVMTAETSLVATNSIKSGIYIAHILSDSGDKSIKFLKN